MDEDEHKLLMKIESLTNRLNQLEVAHDAQGAILQMVIAYLDIQERKNGRGELSFTNIIFDLARSNDNKFPLVAGHVRSFAESLMVQYERYGENTKSEK